VLGGYLAYFMWQGLGINPFVSLAVVASVLFALGWVLQFGLINRVVAQPVLTTLILTFGLDMILYNAMTLAFTATPRRITLDLGSIGALGAMVPLDRLAAMVLAFFLTAALFLVLRTSSLGRAIVAVRMDREAAALMGVQVNKIYAMTFGIGAFMAGACGALLAIVYPVTSSMTDLFLGKAFVVCVLGGLGSVPGALVGGLVLGLIEATAGHVLGPQHAVTAGFVLMLLVLLTRPAGLMGKLGYE
jgi:branched-chain amino acid transport system permease protein